MIDLDSMSDDDKLAALESIHKSIAESKELQKQKIAANVDLVLQALKKMESDIRARYDETGKTIEKRVASIKDGRDGRNGLDGKNGKDGRNGKDGAIGPRGNDGLNGINGVDGQDGVSVTDAKIDFDGSLIITLSTGQEINVGEVVSPDLADKIQVISTMSTNGAVGIKDEGTSISTGVKNINFVGATVTATNSGDDVTVNVSAGTGTVTSVAVSGGNTGLTTSGGPITTTGTITLGGTLAVASGGTGTATPGLVAGTNITSITGSWPNQTINASGGSGTVTSVAATVPAFLSVTGSPITTSGTLAIGLSGSALPIANGGTGNATGTATINANLTGDVTSVGNASTLATVNSNVGSFTNANITVNAKGLITAAASGSPGGVTSVTATSPVASSGGTTPAISLASGYGDTLNPYASKTANFVLAAPNGSAGVPTFRAVVAADIPTLNQSTTGSAASLSATLVATSGGTGQSSYAVGDLLYASTTTALSKLADVATGNALISGGIGVAPSWGQIGLATHVSGTLTEANGGTGTTIGYNGFKNRIINGAMVIDQRNAGASVTINSAANTFSVDRFCGFGDSADGVFTLQQSSTVPTGFTNSLLATVTTADASIGASQRYFVRQIIEGYNVADLGFGAAGAATFTISFWTRSSLTGTFGGSLMNDGFDRAYPFTYTISAANTWEQKTITVVGDTSGTWLKTNGGGLFVCWSLGAGTSRLGTAGAWQTPASPLFGATGQTNIIATNGATFYITGVQLEKGSTATSFDYRPYELQLCQRYYYQTVVASTPNYHTGQYNSTVQLGNVGFLVRMRAAPTMTAVAGSTSSIGDTGVDGFSHSATTTSGAYLTGFKASAEL